jgi:hypothetical protein
MRRPTVVLSRLTMSRPERAAARAERRAEREIRRERDNTETADRRAAAIAAGSGSAIGSAPADSGAGPCGMRSVSDALWRSPSWIAAQTMKPSAAATARVTNRPTTKRAGSSIIASSSR